VLSIATRVQEGVMGVHMTENLRDTDVVLDSLPDEVLATIEIRDAWVASLPQGNGGLEFLIADLQRWTPGTRVTVAFLGGSTDLHRQIAEATSEITAIANIALDFGLDAAAGQFRTWSEEDTEYSADIRVSFDRKGNFSLVGTDSINDNIGIPSEAVGGRPHQRSLNLGGFHIQKPPRWQGTVRHEFLHALAFSHSHQNMRGPCEEEFRWEDDAGYMPTKDAAGRFIPDNADRRPGVYTYLAGFPNFWNKAKVDHNLRRSEGDDVTAGPFDRNSVMLYRFEQFFYKSQPSPCAPAGDGLSLSQDDARGLRLLYPQMGPQLQAIADRSAAMLEVVNVGTEAELGLEEASSAPSSVFAAQATKLLSDRLSALP
jgi:hypothetical protein